MVAAWTIRADGGLIVLNFLQIRDFAIIDATELTLRPGLTVLTGETGAGKSILVDALTLLAGGRAGAEAVRHGAQRAETTIGRSDKVWGEIGASTRTSIPGATIGPPQESA